MSLRLCMLCMVNKHLYAFYIYIQYLSRADGENASLNTFKTLPLPRLRFNAPRLTTADACIKLKRLYPSIAA
jgi:hypothetical protein